MIVTRINIIATVLVMVGVANTSSAEMNSLGSFILNLTLIVMQDRIFYTRETNTIQELRRLEANLSASTLGHEPIVVSLLQTDEEFSREYEGHSIDDDIYQQILDEPNDLGPNYKDKLAIRVTKRLDQHPDLILIILRSSLTYDAKPVDCQGLLSMAPPEFWEEPHDRLPTFTICRVYRPDTANKQWDLFLLSNGFIRAYALYGKSNFSVRTMDATKLPPEVVFTSAVRFLANETTLQKMERGLRTIYGSRVRRTNKAADAENSSISSAGWISILFVAIPSLVSLAYLTYTKILRGRSVESRLMSANSLIGTLAMCYIATKTQYKKEYLAAHHELRDGILEIVVDEFIVNLSKTTTVLIPSLSLSMWFEESAAVRWGCSIGFIYWLAQRFIFGFYRDDDYTMWFWLDILSWMPPIISIGVLLPTIGFKLIEGTRATSTVLNRNNLWKHSTLGLISRWAELISAFQTIPFEVENKAAASLYLRLAIQIFAQCIIERALLSREMELQASFDHRHPVSRRPSASDFHSLANSEPQNVDTSPST